MMKSACLPFPRGKTWSDDFVTLTDTSAQHLEGQIFECEDSIHGTGMPIKLRVVKNDSGGDLTVARKFCKFTTTSQTDFGARSGGFASVAGSVCKPMDDAYTVGQTIKANDLFYVVESGYCDVLTATGTVNLAAGDSIATTASGQVRGSKAVSGEFIAGYTTEAATEAETATTLWINEGLASGFVGT